MGRRQVQVVGGLKLVLVLEHVVVGRGVEHYAGVGNDGYDDVDGGDDVGRQLGLHLNNETYKDYVPGTYLYMQFLLDEQYGEAVVGPSGAKPRVASVPGRLASYITNTARTSRTQSNLLTG